jgi:predicted CopG family antitoxin
MQITVDLSNEIYEQLARLAQSKGVSISEIAAQLLEEAEANRRAAVFEQMRAEGILLPKKPLPPGYERVYKRIDVQGKPVSECLIEERR